MNALDRPTFLTAEWRRLAMANYAVDPGILRPYVPHGTELDLFNGTCYVSLVGFLFTRTRLKGVPVPFHTTFEEVNLRFYVRHRSAEGWRRGVVFIREFVPKPALALVARAFYGEPYRTVPMSHQWRHVTDRLEVTYRWKLKRWNTFAVHAGTTPVDMRAGSEEEFIAEHYWGYTQRGARKTMEYGVEHPRWQVYAIKSYDVDVDFGVLYGDRFTLLNDQQPRSVLLAEGSPIVVSAGVRLE